MKRKNTTTSKLPALVWTRPSNSPITRSCTLVYVSGEFRIARENGRWSASRWLFGQGCAAETVRACNFADAKRRAQTMAVRRAAEEEIRWTATRRGAIYCSAGCGANCTWKAYCDAVKRGAAIARQLGKGWAPQIWENFGWHYCAIYASGTIRASKSSAGYTAYFGANGGGRWTGFGATPIGAVRRAMIAATAERDEITAMIVAAGGDK